jgi:hypothetical protein
LSMSDHAGIAIELTSADRPIADHDATAARN